MLDLLKPTPVGLDLELNGERITLTLHLREPEEAWYQALFAAHELPTGSERDAAVEALYAPEHLAAVVEGWEGIPAEPTRENVAELLRRRRQIRLFVAERLGQAVAREVRKNSEASPAGSTGEAQKRVSGAKRATSAGG